MRSMTGRSKALLIMLSFLPMFILFQNFGSYDPGQESLDLREYFDRNLSPGSGYQVRLNYYNGVKHADLNFQHLAPPNPLVEIYERFFNLRKPGKVMVWVKDYYLNPMSNDPPCRPTIATLFLADDRSVTEVGDWFAGGGCSPDMALGYKKNGVPDGLHWAPPGGLRPGANLQGGLAVWRQNTPGAPYSFSGASAYSSIQFVNRLETFQPRFGTNPSGEWVRGGGRTYRDVVRIILYHGTNLKKANDPRSSPTRCFHKIDPNFRYSNLYKTIPGFEDYESYAIEYFIAKGKGIVQETVVFNETDEWGADFVCKGAALGITREERESSRILTHYIDETYSN